MSVEADLYRQGLTLREIAERTGQGHVTVYNLLDEEGVAFRAKGRRPFDPKHPQAVTARQLRTDGRTIRQIRDALGLKSVTSVYHRLAATEGDHP